MLLHSLLTAAILLSSVVVGQDARMLKLDFDVHRGDSTYDMSPDYEPHFVKRQMYRRDGSYVEAELKNAQSFYMATLKMGSEQDEVSVLLDTGSSDLWVMSKDVTCESSSSSSSSKRRVREIANKTVEAEKQNKNWLSGVESTITEIIGGSSTETAGSGGGGALGGGGLDGFFSSTAATESASNTCVEYGSFATGNSDSFKKNSSTSEFLILYGDGTSAEGVWGYDLVKIGNATVKELSFAVVNDTDSNVGVLGIGLSGLEVTYSSSSLSGNLYQYENMPLKMRNQGLINTNAYSLYLSESSAKKGSILFGAVDHAKYSGTLYTVPVINTLESYGYDTAIRLEIMMDDIYVESNSKNTSITTNSYAALLDSGTTLTYFPSSLMKKFASSLGAEYSSLYGYYLMDCVSDDDETKITINFSGATIEVPLSDLQLSSGNTCVLGALDQDDDYIIFGDNVLRNAYLVYNLEDYEISLAQAKYTTDEDIEIITSSVPSATKAEGYSSTQLSSVTEGSATGDALSSSSSLESSSKKSAASMFGVSLAFMGIALVSTTLIVL